MKPGLLPSEFATWIGGALIVVGAVGLGLTLGGPGAPACGLLLLVGLILLALSEGG